MDLPNVLHTVFLRSPINLFDEFIKECQKWYSEPAHTFVEMRTRDNKKIRGDIFETFCVLYLKHCRGFTNAWRLEDVPEEDLVRLGLKRKDMGIDILCEVGGKFSAVQCKYKKPTGKKMGLTWKVLSTFYALCMRSGPWDKYIVMTNCNYCINAGAPEKSDKYVSICLGSFQGISSEKWIAMCGVKGVQLAETQPKLSVEELREARLKRFESPITLTPPQIP